MVGEQLHEAEGCHGQETARWQERERNVAERQAAVPIEWQPVCASLTTEHVAAWKEETEDLSGADERRDELKRARDEQTGRERRLAQIAEDLVGIPKEAQCPLTTIEEQDIKEGERYREAHTAQREAEIELQRLKTCHAQREDLTAKRAHADRQEHLYGVLAQLLGRDYLQRHLLQQAEMGIVGYANRTLDRISGGTIRLELRQEAAASKGVTKALDLVAYKKDVGDAPLFVDALSGSQRFRVAVSLALGIGEYASRGVKRIETVIIDEGFGSLDQQGRRDIIQELHALKSVLKRIILVSHQEEFFNAFSNGYKIELVDGASRVSDLEVSAAD